MDAKVTVGLANPLNLYCYLNSLLQCYHFLPNDFHQYVNDLSDKGAAWIALKPPMFPPVVANVYVNSDNTHACISFINLVLMFLVRMLVNRETSSTENCETIIHQLFKAQSTEVDRMQDVFEIHERLMDMMHVTSLTVDGQLAKRFEILFQLKHLANDLPQCVLSVSPVNTLDQTVTLNSVRECLCHHWNLTEHGHFGCEILPRILVLRLDRTNTSGKKYSHAVMLDEELEFSIHDQVSKFQLLSVIEHRGNHTSSGHYVTHVRQADGWIECNDSNIEARDKLETSVSQNASLLFYVRNVPGCPVQPAAMSMLDRSIWPQIVHCAQQIREEEQRKQQDAKKLRDKLTETVNLPLSTGFLPLHSQSEQKKLLSEDVKSVLHSVQMNRDAHAKSAIDSAGGYQYQTAVALFQIISLIVKPERNKSDPRAVDPKQMKITDSFWPKQQWFKVMEEGVDDIDIWSEDNEKLLLIQCKWKVADPLSIKSKTGDFVKHMLHHVRIAARDDDFYNSDLVRVQVEYWTQTPLPAHGVIHDWQEGVQALKSKPGKMSDAVVATMKKALENMVAAAKLDATEMADVGKFFDSDTRLRHFLARNVIVQAPNWEELLDGSERLLHQYINNQKLLMVSPERLKAISHALYCALHHHCIVNIMQSTTHQIQSNNEEMRSFIKKEEKTDEELLRTGAESVNKRFRTNKDKADYCAHLGLRISGSKNQLILRIIKAERELKAASDVRPRNQLQHKKTLLSIGARIVTKESAIKFANSTIREWAIAVDDQAVGKKLSEHLRQYAEWRKLAIQSTEAYWYNLLVQSAVGRIQWILDEDDEEFPMSSKARLLSGWASALHSASRALPNPERSTRNVKKRERLAKEEKAGEELMSALASDPNLEEEAKLKYQGLATSLIRKRRKRLDEEKKEAAAGRRNCDEFLVGELGPDGKFSTSPPLPCAATESEPESDSDSDSSESESLSDTHLVEMQVPHVMDDILHQLQFALLHNPEALRLFIQ